MELSGEENVYLKTLIQNSKNLLLNSKTLLFIAKQNGSHQDFISTSQNISKLCRSLEDFVMKMQKIDHPGNKELKAQLLNLEKASLSIRECAVSLIMIVSRIQKSSSSSSSSNSPLTETEVEKMLTNIQNLCKELALGVKNLIISGDHIIRLLKEEVEQGIVRKDETLLRNNYSDLKELNLLVLVNMDHLLNLISQRTDQSKFPQPSDLIQKKFQQGLAVFQAQTGKLITVAKALGLSDSEWRIYQVSALFVHQIQLYFILGGDEEYQMVRLAKYQVQDALWWFQILVGQHKKQRQLEQSFKKKEEELLSREKNLRNKQAKLDQKLKTFSNLKHPQPNIEDDSLGKQTLSSKIFVSLVLPLNLVVKTVLIPENDITASKFKEECFEKYYAKKFPKYSASDYTFKIPGLLQYIDGNEPLLSFPYIKDCVDNGKKITLLLIEKLSSEVKDIPDSVKKSEEKAISLYNEPPLHTYQGDLIDQFKTYQTNGNSILANMMLEYQVRTNDMKELFNNDLYLQRLKEMKQKVKDESAHDTGPLKLFETLNRIVDETFDQYQGLRQIADFRGIPESGEVLVREGNNIHNLFKKMMLSCQVKIVDQVLVNGGVIPNGLENAFREASEKLLKHFYDLKTGVLNQIHYVSSLRECQENSNLNCSYARMFMKEIMDKTIHHIVSLRKKIESKFKEIQLCPEEVQNNVYAKFNGQINFEMEVEVQFSKIQPWVEKWIEVQVPAIVHREIFAKDRTILETILQESKEQMINAFKELLNSDLLEPLIRLQELMELLSMSSS